jgi:hypothetical protein
MKRFMVLLLSIVREDIHLSWISANNKVHGTFFKTFLFSENEQERNIERKPRNETYRMKKS